MPKRRRLKRGATVKDYVADGRIGYYIFPPRGYQEVMSGFTTIRGQRVGHIAFEKKRK